MRLLKIGRDASCDIVMHSPSVSSLHAELTLLNSGDILLEDKGSRNGTFIMNQPIKPNKPVNVRRGDAIRFADVELQWSQVPMPEDNSAYQGIYGIGSHFNNDFQISGGTVSRYHATVKHGRDGKMYIVDHSKNGTMVNGTKIPSNTPYRIKKSSAVVCGGVPVDLSRLPWPKDLWKYIAGIAASVLILVAVGFGAWKYWPGKGKSYNDNELYNRYSSSIVMLKGIYHYEVKIGDLDIDDFNDLVRQVQFISALQGDNVEMYLMSHKWLHLGTQYVPIGDLNDKELISELDKLTEDKGLYSGTGFFISNDGQVVTNLHVVKPWLEGDQDKELQNEVSRRFAADVENINRYLKVGLSAYISQVEVKGVLDLIALVPQGEVFDAENIKKCQLVSAGDDLNKDVALIKMVSGMTPSNCTYVNVKDSIDVEESHLEVGAHVITFGFPHAHQLQENTAEQGLRVFSHPGEISRVPNEFGFHFTSVSAGGASGSPIFNSKGMLIGILSAGVPGENITFGIKSKYIKELLEQPHKK